MDAKDDVSWVVMGDLDEVAWHFEKEGSAIWNPKRKRYLIDFMTDNNLMDLGYKGHIFTWERSLGNTSFVKERLDRALSNTSWREKWPNTTITIGTRIESDHSLLVLECNPTSSKSKRNFKFEAKWRILTAM